MTPEQFSSRFCLYNLQNNKPITRFEPNSKTQNAAVLVPVIKRPTGLTLLFTQRDKHMRHHPGQISFPGGKADPDDHSLTFTALRETYEEVGIDETKITTLGWLPSFQTISNFSLHPLVGLIEDISDLTLNPGEVDNAFEVPLTHFTNRDNHHIISPYVNNTKHPVHFMPYQGKLIWGATAAIIDQLILHFE